tara:strand:- start:2087 stop:3073 length:987 start_codon:yes stop_codon:yes gene_type:complete
MTIKESLKQIKLGKIKFVYFLKGNDSFLHSFFTEKVSEYYFKGSKHEKTLILPDEMSGKEIIGKLLNEDLFLTKELFIIRNPQSIRGKYRDDLIKYCSSPLRSKILILIIDDWFDKSLITKKISKLNEIINVQTPFENEMRLWAKYFFKKEKTIVNSDVINLVTNIAGDNLAHLKNEIEKICLWSDNKKEITAKDIKIFSGWKRERHRWEFLIAVGNRNFDNSIILGKSILTKSETFLSLIYPLTALFQEILFFRLNNGTFLPNRGYIPLSNSLRNRIPEFSKRYSKKELENILRYLGYIDKNTKRAYLNEENEFIQFIEVAIGKNAE